MLTKLIECGPEAAGYDRDCWDTVLLQDLIASRFGVEYHPHYVAELLKKMGFSWQKACFVSNHLDDVAEAQQHWLAKIWPEVVQLTQEKGAMVLKPVLPNGIRSVTPGRPKASSQQSKPVVTVRPTKSLV